MFNGRLIYMHDWKLFVSNRELGFTKIFGKTSEYIKSCMSMKALLKQLE